MELSIIDKYNRLVKQRKEASKKYYQTNIEKCREVNRVNSKKYYQKKKEKILLEKQKRNEELFENMTIKLSHQILPHSAQ